MGLLIYMLGSTVALYVLFPVIWNALRRWLIAKESAFYDLRFLGVPRPTESKLKGTAVICGGSYAGLFAARVCHDHFERVVILEAETWLNTEDARRTDSWEQQAKRTRVAQYDGLQGTQPFVHDAMKQLYPNLNEECAAADIKITAWDWNTYFWGNYIKSPSRWYGGSLPKCLYAGRRGLETLARRLTLNHKLYPNIEQIIGTVTGINVNDEHPGLLKEVSYRDAEGKTRTIDAALVVDATGSTQAGIKWLKRLGFAEDIQQESYDPKMHYATFEFAIPPGLAARLPVPGGFDQESGSIFVHSPDASRDHRFFGLIRNEGGRVHVCCGVWGGGDVPTSLEGVKDYAKALVVDKPLPSWIFEFIDLLHEVQDSMTVHFIRVGPSYWNRFENCRKLPDNFIALGDSVSRINPVYGHGVAKALTGASCLNVLLQNEYSIPTGLSKCFFAMQATKIASMWTGPKLFDYAYMTTTPAAGETHKFGALLRWYMGHLQRLRIATGDEQAGVAVYRTLAMLDGASIDLLHPLLVVKVLWHAYWK
ncbi:hypothetical protein CYLTODRAFT_380853 [Cylindrobasidium torrendii FP15055 ss-10]|uniref:FAD/NAD(P)-binding domain-containing protein n=1 Tax=Cylindrobasidium torrendii FP15055 ss-10 TaxID=1314674 RepID=A0A0D7B1W4_9AGAR|nr:hypothetical protein CYLTODRAFT_380853 [Cylindrobasidium torrendii FP15055 ss-10]